MVDPTMSDQNSQVHDPVYQRQDSEDGQAQVKGNMAQSTLPGQDWASSQPVQKNADIQAREVIEPVAGNAIVQPQEKYLQNNKTQLSMQQSDERGQGQSANTQVRISQVNNQVGVVNQPQAGLSQPTDNSIPTQTANFYQPIAVGNKERVEFGPKMGEISPMLEAYGDKQEMEPEVEGWLEKLEQADDIQLPQPVLDDQGQVVLADAGSRVMEEKIVLPMTPEQMEVGLKASVGSSARWLAEWVKKLVKQMGDRVVYQQR
jgi:hypothetical protein